MFFLFFLYIRLGPKTGAIAVSEFEVTVLLSNEPVAYAELITKPASMSSGII